MNPVENTIIEALLGVARKRPQSPNSPAGIARGAREEITEKAIRRREAQFSDFEAIAALKERWGLGTDSRENWKRLWQDNPALSGRNLNLPIGWVQEVEGEIVGYLGNIPLLYQYGEQTLLATTTTSYSVDPAYRSRALGMVGSFFRQRGCDLYLNTTATQASGKIMQAFKADQLPQRDYEAVLFWVLDAQDVLHSLAQKLGVSDKLGAAAAWLGSPALRGDIVLRKRRPTRTGTGRLSCRELCLDEIGDDFQGLWLGKLHEKPRLLACRTPEILRWHFLIPNSGRVTQILACYEGSRLAGYAVVLTQTVRQLGLRKSLVADLFVAGDKPEVITELLLSTYEVAQENGSDVLEVLGFPEEVRSICRAWRPYTRNSRNLGPLPRAFRRRRTGNPQVAG